MTQTAAFNARRAGFTLVELLVVIVIIGVLATLALSRLSAFRDKAKETQTAANLADINRGLEAFATDNNGMYPFRVRWFDAATANAPGFDPYKATDTGGGFTSDANDWFSLGLFGGVKVVDDQFNDNTYTGQPTATQQQNGWLGMNEHKIIQPNGWNQQFWRRFNQYSDPLVALGYMQSYPTNPFLKRPMGNIMYSYGDAADEADTSSPYYTWPPANYNSSIPSPDVVVSAGDFVYTFFYEGNGAAISDPGGIAEAKKSYQPKTPKMTDTDGAYYLDMVDSYQLWAYGRLPLNGGKYVAYRNNRDGLSVPRGGAKRDWNGNGTKDMFETGLIQYFKRAGTAESTARTAGGNKVEF
jgi:prepilin-type N-terminal cleavage/methylation domain-containing protein